MKKIFYLITLLFIVSCNSQSQQTPESFIRAIEAINKDADKFENDFSEMATDSPEDFKIKLKEANQMINNSLEKLDKLTEMNEEFPVKKEYYELLKILEDITNDESVMQIIEKGQNKKDTQKIESPEELDQELAELGDMFEIMKQLMPKVVTMGKKADSYEKVLAAYYEHYKITPVE